jgi:hypothetical protein
MSAPATFRSAKDYDYGHITKPSRSSISAPVCTNDYTSLNQCFLDEVTWQMSY